jgi:hypothetical protein
MEWINEIAEIILAHKVIITWIVIGWLLIVYLIVKPLHKKAFWRDLIRGIGEVTLGGLWAIICAALFHPIPGLSIMLFVVFGMFHRIRQFKDKIRDDKEAARNVVGPIYIVIYIAVIILLNWWMRWDLAYDFRRGVAQLTSNTVFADAGKSCKHWFACDCNYPLRATGIRPSEPKEAEADTSSWPSRIFGGSPSTSTATKKTTSGKSR